ncbi:MAG: FKBP-type peptidyl-prolyl cis-trans isomerase, partial [Bacteroidales bacterium]|nr:FKBP-type peptidyl-prolyl cis-trans isomerase [Bacteroidales bacterium]
ENYGIYDYRRLYGTNKMQQGYNIPGFNEGLSLMKEGGRARLLFKSDLGYGDNIIGPIAAYSSLIIDVELLKVIIDPVLEEYENTIDFLIENEYSIDTTESGIFYTEIAEGTGDLILVDDLVTFNIKASLLDGRILYENENLQFYVGSSEYESTAGLSEGIKYMKLGGVSRVIVPYQLAFGPFEKTYYDGFYKVPIPPYSTIVYDVEITLVE